MRRRCSQAYRFNFKEILQYVNKILFIYHIYQYDRPASPPGFLWRNIFFNSVSILCRRNQFSQTHMLFLNNVMHSTLHSALNTQICIHIQKEGYAHHRKYETEIYSLGLALLVTKGITL